MGPKAAIVAAILREMCHHGPVFDPVPPCRTCGADVILEFGRAWWSERRECTNPECPSRLGEGPV
jgi:hypothetical protein